MRKLLLFCVIFKLTTLNAQSYKDTIREFQQHLNEEYKDAEKSPLSNKDLENFTGHTFFPINEAFNIKAKFQRILHAVPFQMKTTTSRLPTYEVYAIASFIIDGKEFQLHIYQSHSLRSKKKYKKHLFLPFTDSTNGITSYSGGRYIDLEIPEGDTILIDFNKAYNPYCAYSPTYSCPIPPKENNLPIAINAGIKFLTQ